MEEVTHLHTRKHEQHSHRHRTAQEIGTLVAVLAGRSGRSSPQAERECRRHGSARGMRERPREGPTSTAGCQVPANQGSPLRLNFFSSFRSACTYDKAMAAIIIEAIARMVRRVKPMALACVRVGGSSLHRDICGPKPQGVQLATFYRDSPFTCSIIQRLNHRRFN